MMVVKIYFFTLIAVLTVTHLSSSQVSDRVRRAVAQPTFPHPCFLDYFLGRQMPQGLWNNANHPSLRFICQTLSTTPGIDYYATVFDDNAGIAILSAYTVTATDANNIKSADRSSSWRQTSGLSNQGTDSLYYKNADKADKGHLNPVKINSFDDKHVKATFTYSNAVPQYRGWNRGQWRIFEGRIVNYVRTKCAAKGGKMYLMTGTSQFRLQIGAATPTQDPNSTPNPLFGNAIELPNSMWTAGCCEWNNNGLNYESIAVMGNNDPNIANTETVSMTTLGTLENILVATGQPAADLFPGSNGNCRANSQQM